MTLAERGLGPANCTDPEQITMSRLSWFRAAGVIAAARESDTWLFDGGIGRSESPPWLVVSPNDLSLEIVFAPATPFVTARSVLRRLLADRWKVTVYVPPACLPEAVSSLGDLPLAVRRWDRLYRVIVA